MGRKGKGYRRQQDQEPVKKKNVITEEQLMDKSHMDRTQFIPFLIGQSLYEPFCYTEANIVAIKQITLDLNHLLYVPFKNFWATVLYNPTLKNCLSTCLSYLHRRWMNNYRYSTQTQEQFASNEENMINWKRVKDQEIYQYTEGLTQVVIVIYHRIVSFNSQNKDLSQLYKIGEEITRKFIIDIPKLLELAQIYGESNPEIVNYIIKMYSKTVPIFYQQLTNTILPFIFKKMQDLLRRTKSITERQQFGVNLSYKRMQGKDLSQAEEQLCKKVSILMQMVSFIQVIKNIMSYFPAECVDHCYFNSQIQMLFENMFLELEVAYKVWNYQSQEIKLLNMINFIIKECIDYFVKYFDRCNQIIVLRSFKSSTFDAYVNSLQRVFKQFGRRFTVGKKNQSRNLLMYKIIKKRFDVLKMAQTIYQQQTEDDSEHFNLQYLKDFIIALQTEFKEEYINEQDVRQQEIEEETQAPQDQHEDFEENQNNTQIQKVQEQKQVKEQKRQEPELQQLQTLVPKRLRSEDYYAKLYADFNNKYYKGQYEDDYDDVVDYDKRPLFFDEESSNSQSETQTQRHLVSNANNLQYIKSLHNQTKINREKIRAENANKPKYEQVSSFHTNSNNQAKQDKPKPKYVEKQNEASQMKQENPLQGLQQGQREQQRGGQGFKKNNKSYNHKPRQKHEPFDKHRNTNKNRDQKGGNNKKYRQK